MNGSALDDERTVTPAVLPPLAKIERPFTLHYTLPTTVSFERDEDNKWEYTFSANSMKEIFDEWSGMTAAAIKAGKVGPTFVKLVAK